MKLLKLFIILILVSGCVQTKQKIEPTITATPPITDSKNEIEQKSDVDLIIEGIDVLNTYLINNQLSKRHDNEFYQVILNGDTYSIAKIYYSNSRIDASSKFKDITLKYTLKDKEKTATLSTTYFHSITFYNSHLESTLVTNDNQTFTIYFDQNRVKIYDQETKEEIVFNDDLQEQLITTYKKQWIEAVDLRKALFDFAKKILTYKGVTEIDNSLFEEDLYYPHEWTYFPLGETGILFPRFVQSERLIKVNSQHAVAIKDTNSIYRTTSLLSTLSYNPSSIESISKDDVLLWMFGFHNDYVCLKTSCTDSNGNPSKMFKQGTRGEGFVPIVTVNSANHILKSSLNTQDSFFVDDTIMLPNGIIQSKEEQTFISNSGGGEGFTSYLGLRFDTESDDGYTIVASVIPYRVTVSSSNESGVTFTIQNYDNTFEVIYPSYDDINKVETYISEHVSQFSKSKVTLIPSDDSNFYQIQSIEPK